MYSVVVVHELGHIVMSLIFNYKIKRINIYPFGGYILFDDSINKQFIEDFLVFFGGILFQIVFFLIIILVINKNTYLYSLFYNYNLTILLFNMLPIIPLDGSKILNIIMNYIYPFKISHLMTIYISYILILILIIINYKDINMILMGILLLFILIKEHKNHLYIYNTFLLERYIKNVNYKNNNFINSFNINRMKKYFNNIFIYKNKYYDEKNVLKNRYKYNDEI